MLRLRLFVLGSLLAIATTGLLLGQDKKSGEKETPVPKGKGTLPTYYKKLGLSDDQTQKVFKIHTSYKTKVDALQQQINDLKKEEKAELEKVLTEGQRVRLRELRLGESDSPKEPPVKEKKLEEPKKDR